MTMTDEEREERAEKRATDLRVKRVKKVWKSLSRAKRKTSAQISAETGFSIPLVLSTINMIRQETDGRPGSAVAYSPKTHEFWVANSWPEQKLATDWLARHLVTRTRNLTKFIDVAAGLWPADVPVDLLIGMGQMEDATKRIEGVIDVPQEQPSMSVTRPPIMRG